MALLFAPGCGSDGDETSTSTSTTAADAPGTSADTSAPDTSAGTSSSVPSADVEAAMKALSEADPEGLLVPIQDCIDFEQLAVLVPPGANGYDLEGETLGATGSRNTGDLGLPPGAPAGALATSSLGKLVLAARSEAERCGVQVTIIARFENSMAPTSFLFATP